MTSYVRELRTLIPALIATVIQFGMLMVACEETWGWEQLPIPPAQGSGIWGLWGHVFLFVLSVNGLLTYQVRWGDTAWARQDAAVPSVKQASTGGWPEYARLSAKLNKHVAIGAACAIVGACGTCIALTARPDAIRYVGGVATFLGALGLIQAALYGNHTWVRLLILKSTSRASDS